jgi:2-polyprenyl-3-methyl-5-hydroxy-6-metoxy-1,4-benzoquinol methylase
MSISLLRAVTERRLQPEIIDQPDIEPRLLHGALRGLERINWWSGSARILWQPIRRLAGEQQARPVRILDVATGAGDMPIRLWRKACRAGVKVEIAGCDRSGEAVAYARKRAEQQNAPLNFFEWDALNGSFPGEPDIVISSLFLHHLEQEQAAEFLGAMAEAAGCMVLVNDLERCRAGFVLAYLGTRVLSASSVVHTDGPRSVEGAFTIAEAKDLAQRAGLHAATVERRWPCRYLLSWRRDRTAPTPGNG